MATIIEKNSCKIKEVDLKFFNSDYYSLFKRMSTVAGLWPYQRRFQRILINISLLLLVVLSVIPQIVAVHKFYFVELDRPRFLKALSTMVCFLQASGIYLLSLHNIEKMKSLCFKITQHLKLFEKKRDEFELLKKRTLFGKWLSKIYTVYVLYGGILYATLPFSLPLTLDLLFPLQNNETRKLLYVLDGEYMVEKRDYYITITLFESIIIFVLVLISMGFDTIFLTLIFHCVALMDIVKSRLHLSMKTEDHKEEKDMNNVYHKMIEAVKLHKITIRFTKKVIDYNSTIFLMLDIFLMLWGVIGINVIIAHSDMPQEVFRFLLALLAALIHLGYMAFLGQILTDKSKTIFDELYSLEWYKLSVKIKKIVLFMMMNTKKPLQLTSGDLHPINYEFLGLYMKTAGSYVMNLASVSAFEEK